MRFRHDPRDTFAASELRREQYEHERQLKEAWDNFCVMSSIIIIILLSLAGCHLEAML